MRESQLEARLARGVQALGGAAYKFVSPGQVGVPDRLVVLPGGRVLFAELKAAGGRLSRVQRLQIDRLRCLGAETWVVRGEDGVREFLEALGGASGATGPADRDTGPSLRLPRNDRSGSPADCLGGDPR